MNWSGGHHTGPPGDVLAWLYVMVGEVHATTRNLTSGQQQIMDRLSDGRDRMDWLTAQAHARAAETREIKAALATMQPSSSSSPAEKAGLIRALIELAKATRDLAKAVAPLKEWTAGATVVASSLYAIVKPDMVRAFVTWLTGGAL